MPRRRRWIALMSGLLDETSGSQLIEFAFGLPLLVVMSVAVSQFGGAFNLKQILNNAAREGARVAANENSDFGTLSNCAGGSCVAAVAEAVSNYLQTAGVQPQCTFGTSGTSSGTFSWTFNSSSGGTCSTASLKVERAVSIVSGAATIKSTRVTLTYPSRYTMGGVLGLIGGGPALPTSLTTNAIMSDIN